MKIKFDKKDRFNKLSEMAKEEKNILEGRIDLLQRDVTNKCAWHFWHTPTDLKPIIESSKKLVKIAREMKRINKW